MSNQHIVFLDRAGYGNYSRITCLTCNETCLKKLYMNLIAWREEVKEFNERHPSGETDTYVDYLTDAIAAIGYAPEVIARHIQNRKDKIQEFTE